MDNIAIFTIFSGNYLANVRSLFESSRAVHPDVDCYAILVDEIENFHDIHQELFHVIEGKNLDIPDFEELSFKYDILELNTAIKPFGFKHLFSKGYSKILYFDPDIYIYNRLDYLFDQLDGFSAIITPHIISPMPTNDALLPSEQSFLSTGIYNLGFISFSKTMETMNFIDWWSERCHEACYKEIESGLFVDQKWIDFLPAFIEKVLILRDPGYNMAYWNLHERFLQGLEVNKRHPLMFFHFSGYNINNIELISRHQTRFKLSDRNDLQNLFADYKERLLANGYNECSKWRYKYGYYENGEPIGILSRRIYSSVKYDFSNPFSVRDGSYYNYLKKSYLLEKPTINSYIINIEGINNGRNRKMYENFVRLLIKIVGVDKYMHILEHIRNISTPRQQKFLLKKK